MKKVLSFVFVFCLTLILYSENNKFYFEIGPNYGFMKKFYVDGQDVYPRIKRQYDEHDEKKPIDFSGKFGATINDKITFTLNYDYISYAYSGNNYEEPDYGYQLIYIYKHESNFYLHYVAPGIIVYPLPDVQISASLGRLFGKND